jgi:signal transduction histidine kinase
MGFLSFGLKEKQEKRRLEAFLNALPHEYCGWGRDGTVIWSKNFPHLFDLATIQTIRDIQNAILPSDAAALEGMIYTLKNDREPFSLKVQTVESMKTLIIHGQEGSDLDGLDSYDVLWVEDATQDMHALNALRDDIDGLNSDIQLYQIILDALPQAVWTSDDRQKIRYHNKLYKDILKSESEADLIGHQDNFNPVLSDAQKLSVSEMAKQSLNSGEADHSKGRMIINGKRRMLDIHVTPSPKEEYTILSAYDITEQENLKVELDRYVAANASLLENLSTAIAIFRADHHLEFYNQGFSTLWGLEDQWLNSNPTLGDVLEKLREMRRLPEQANFRDYKKGWLDMFTALIDQKQEMLYLPDGLAVRVTIVAHPMGGLMMTFEDVTSRLELESSYNTLIAVQKETLDNLSDGVAVFGSDARLRFCNPAYLRQWALNPEDTETHPHVNELIEKKKRFFKGKNANWDDIKQRLTHYVISRSDLNENITRTDGIVLECNAVSLPDGAVMVTYRNVTDSVRVRHALEEKNQALMDAEKLKTDFLANVSYQLRTPLNAISGFAEILNHEYFGDINDKQREYTQGITDAAERLASLIDDVLDLSSIEAGYLRLDKNETDITILMESVYNLTREWAGMETLRIIYTAPKHAIEPLYLDDRRMKQAIVNIIRNAISYTPSGGIITLKVKDEAERVLITITDTGIGIPEDEKDKIFEPFKRITAGEEGAARPHTGLGLSLAKNIIAMHDGDITVESVLGEGTTVIIALPK